MLILGTYEFELLNPEVESNESFGQILVEASADYDMGEDSLGEISLDNVSVDVLTPHGEVNVVQVARLNRRNPLRGLASISNSAADRLHDVTRLV